MWRLLALTFAVAHGDLLTEDSDHNIHVFQKHSWPTSLRSNMLDTAITKTLHVHGNLDVEGKLVHGAIILNITNLASKTELAEAVAASTAGLNITNLASKTELAEAVAASTAGLNITNLASKTELAEAVAASTAGLNITNLASKTELAEAVAASTAGLNITNLASKTELAEAVAASTAGLNITNLASNVFYSTDEVDAKIAAVQSATSGFLSVQNNSITIGSTVLSEQTLKDLNDLVDITDITIENNITIGSTVLSEQTLKDLNGLLALNLTKLAALLDITDIID